MAASRACGCRSKELSVSAVDCAQQVMASTMMERVERLDLVVGYLEDMRGGGSPSASTTCPSSEASTPRRRCRSATEALQEAQAKGSLVDRIALLENRVLKMEEDLETRSDMSRSPSRTSGGELGRKTKTRKKKGLRSLVKTCVLGNLRTKE